TCGDKFGFCDKKSDNYKVALPSAAYVTACKFNDFNGNHVQDLGEETLPHWPISATGVDGGPIHTSTHDFCCVPFSVMNFPGTSGGSMAATMQLSEGTLGAKWSQTAPVDGVRVRSGTTPAYTVTGGVVSTTDLRPGDVLEIDFGNHNDDCNDPGECGTV